MTHLTVSGRRERIPPFPHHKNYVHQSRRFFFARSALEHVVLGRGIAVREAISGFLHRCFVPRLLLIDPTSACNLHCTGCWAADYGRGDELSFEKLDEILVQSEKLGIEFVTFSGGEPMLRKDDILKLAARHRRTNFSLYTNGTLVDAAFVDGMARLGNLNLFLSIEGWREETDFRRGAGTYDQVVAAMDLLRSRGIGFGFSACYHAKNYEVVSSDAFLDSMREKGAWLGWLFQYIPVGNGADLSLVCTPEQRATVKRRVDAYALKHDFVLVDFWNNG
ncbi:MAG: radical SAM protein, partial [Rectinemataceae bacterium]